LKFSKKILHICSLFCLVAISIAILFFGLRPKGFSFSNGVNWITDRAGIHFRKYGISYTNHLDIKIEDNTIDSNKISLEIALKIEKPYKNGFSFIFAIHNGKDSSQLLLAQWHSEIIFMNGDDYDYKRKSNRIFIDTALLPDGPLFLTMTTGSLGTKLYCDGKLIKEIKDLTLELPSGGKSRLLLGNSVYGTNSWEGDVYGLAFYRSTLTDEDVTVHFNRWSEERGFSFVKTDKPFVLFLFNEKEGEWANDHAVGNDSLNIPKTIKILEKKILVPPWQDFKFEQNNVEDILINAIGFMPLGFFLFATLNRLDGNSVKHGILITAILCFILSLFIEIVQAWIPSRSSSMTDLISNTFGGWIGAITLKFFSRKVFSF
jgi:glycopeptide antibiotics resistance protein